MFELTTNYGYMGYWVDEDYWQVNPTSPAQHERLVAAFFRSIGVDSAPAQRVAEAVVAKRQAEGVFCQGTGYLMVFTYREDDGGWVTAFFPATSDIYERYPAC